MAQLDEIGVLPESQGGDSLAEAVYETLMEAIVSGRLEPGTVLSAVQLAAKLEVSRTPVQLALRLLASDGLVETATNRRAKVKRFTADDLFNVFEMRRLLEGRAAELAAGRMDVRSLGPLRDMQTDLEAGCEGVDWRERWHDYDELFHGTIAGCCGNPLLRADIDRYRLLHRGFNRLSTDVASLQRALAEHGAILAALESRDAATAKAGMAAHIGAWQRFFVEQFPRPR